MASSVTTTFKSDPCTEQGLDENFYCGEHDFTFPNGDNYKGEFIAHRSGVVWREGMGTYTTKDGQIYTGLWKDDKLAEDNEIEISYPDGSQYFGNILKDTYNGPAMFVIDQSITILSEFIENKPTGEAVMIDGKGKLWHGSAAENECILFPEHIYFNDIGSNQGKGQPRNKALRNKRSEPQLIKRPSHKVLQQDILDKDLELKIFAKTKKTVSDLRFEDSDWYQNYIKFRAVYEEITTKISEQGLDALCDEEIAWYEKYKGFKTKYYEIMEARENKNKNLSDFKLFELFNSDEYKNIPPIPIFYPTQVSTPEGVEEEQEPEEVSESK